MEPISKVDCPIETPVFYPAETLPYEVTDILSGIRTSRRPARCGEPRNQSDCPAGTKFREGMPETTGGAYMRAIPAICIKSVFAEDYGGYGPVAPAKECPLGTMHDRTRGGACVDIELLKKEGKFTEGTPLSPITTKTMGVGSNWLLPALLIGAGIFILTRKSE